MLISSLKKIAMKNMWENICLSFIANIITKSGVIRPAAIQVFLSQYQLGYHN